MRLGTAALVEAGVGSPALDARLLLGHVMGLGQGALLGALEAEVPEGAFAALLARRVGREPVALILGRQEFWSLEFAVSSATLIPRADSETLIEAAVDARPDRTVVRRVLDLGTGTGCLLLAALTEFDGAWGLGVDVSADAAALARGNSRALGLAGRSAFVVGNWGEAVGSGFDLVLSNPPYIPGGELVGLMAEVVGFEPRRALDGGVDGLDGYRALLGQLGAADGAGGGGGVRAGVRAGGDGARFGGGDRVFDAGSGRFWGGGAGFGLGEDAVVTGRFVGLVVEAMNRQAAKDAKEERGIWLCIPSQARGRRSRVWSGLVIVPSCSAADRRGLRKKIGSVAGAQ